MDYSTGGWTREVTVLTLGSGPLLWETPRTDALPSRKGVSSRAEEWGTWVSLGAPIVLNL